MSFEISERMSQTDSTTCPNTCVTDLNESSVPQPDSPSSRARRDELTADECLAVIYGALDRSARLNELKISTTRPEDTDNKAVLARRVTSPMAIRRALVHQLSEESRRLHRYVGNGNDPAASSQDNLEAISHRINTMPPIIFRRASTRDRCNADVIALTRRFRQDETE
jgi:hypothetical protein